MATSDPITKILQHHQTARYIWGKALWYERIILICLRLRATQIWRGHQKPPSPSPTPPPGRIGLTHNGQTNRDSTLNKKYTDQPSVQSGSSTWMKYNVEETYKIEAREPMWRSNERSWLFLPFISWPNSEYWNSYMTSWTALIDIALSSTGSRTLIAWNFVQSSQAAVMSGSPQPHIQVVQAWTQKRPLEYNRFVRTFYSFCLRKQFNNI